VSAAALKDTGDIAAAAERIDAIAGDATPPVSPLARALVDACQRDFPLTPRPYAALAERFGVAEADVLQALTHLGERGVLSRVGAVLRPNRAGRSTLAAMAVPPARLTAVAALVSGYPEVNHNYEREHRFNLWFVATASDAARLQQVLEEIAARTGLAVLDLPLSEAFHIDLGFPIQWR
jgi:DNA-binding Lrp family transcriptional regulator